MKNYFVFWTYIANYGVLRDYPGESPEDVARKVVAGFSPDFRARGKVYVFEQHPACTYEGLASGGTYKVPALAVEGGG